MQVVDLRTLCDRVVERVIDAGQLLIAEWSRPEGPRGAGDKADVDIEIEQQLRRELLQLLDCDFWGEETGHVLTGHQCCWVIDPNDGTSDFLNGLKGSAISVGLLRDAVPVLGVVYSPVNAVSGPDCIAWAEGMPSLWRNGQLVDVSLRGRQLDATSVVMVSAAAATKPELNAQLCAPAGFLPMPSIAYRLARVAAGDGVCAVSLFPLSAHDVVAGHALLRAVSGVLLDQEGLPVTYATGMALVSKQCFGGAPQACSTLQQRNWASLLSAPLDGARQT